MGVHRLSAAGRHAALAVAAVLCLPLLAPVHADQAQQAQQALEGSGELFSATSKRRFDDVEHWTRVFDDPDRATWQKPQHVVDRLELAPGMTVADLGAGTGYFSAALSRAVGDEGTVYAVETEPALVAHLRERAELEDSANLVPVLASFDNPRLPRHAVDRLLVVDTFHHIDDRLEYFRRLSSRLTKQGRVAIVDWKKEELPVGPDIDHKLARDQVVEEMERAGYQLVDESTELPYQYFVIFRPRSPLDR